MSDARSAILASVRSSLIQGEQRSITSRNNVEERIQHPGISIQPDINDDLLATYFEKHEAVRGTFDHLSQEEDIVEALDCYLNKHNLDPELVSGVGPILDNVSWPQSWKIYRRSAQKLDRVIISEAFAGIAETGTLAFLRTAANPTSHLFLAEDHVVVLDASRIVKYQEDLWKLLRTTYEVLPKAVNLITGPSKTADVEQTIEYGAHGPCRIHVFVIDSKL